MLQSMKFHREYHTALRIDGLKGLEAPHDKGKAGDICWNTTYAYGPLGFDPITIL